MVKKETKREMKERAQDSILHFAEGAFLAAVDYRESEEYVKELRRQFARIERLFGIIPGSTSV